MDRRRFLVFLGSAAAFLPFFRLNLMEHAMAQSPVPASPLPGSALADDNLTPVVKTDAEWKAALPAESYEVLRHEGTEAPFTSPLNKEKHSGTFVCMGCNLPLFQSTKKFDSGTGWPSFFDTIPGHIKTKSDTKLFMERTEYHCSRCDGHQGHVFNDGPAPTGLRYCNNGVALKFIADPV